MFTVCTNDYTLLLQERGLPTITDEYAKHAALNDYFESQEDHGEWCYVAISHTQRTGWPFLTVTQRFSPAGGGFEPGVVLIPETSLLFIGAGAQLLAYDLKSPCRLWEDMADCGFWGWARHNNTIVMSAELEMAAWDLHGTKLWRTVVEPPWGYAVRDNTVELDIMGLKSSFDLVTGPNEKLR